MLTSAPFNMFNCCFNPTVNIEQAVRRSLLEAAYWEQLIGSSLLTRDQGAQTSTHGAQRRNHRLLSIKNGALSKNNKALSRNHRELSKKLEH